MALDKPDGSMLITVHGQSPAESRNIIIQQALDNDCTHVFLMDDDVIVPQDAIIKLLSHDKDIVCGLYLMRGFPHFPVIFDEPFPDGQCKYMFLTSDKQALVPIVNCGFGIVLINTRVFKGMEKPWVRLGEIIKDGWCDDIGFFNRAREAGFKLFCDLDVRAGHMASVTVWPAFTDGRWVTEYTHSGGKIMIPQTVPQEAVK